MSARERALRDARDAEGFLVCQDILEPVFRFGALSTERKGRWGGNLCGPMALYNVRHALGEAPDFGEILRGARAAMLLGGLWGTHPWGLARVLRGCGYSARVILGRQRIERAAREADACILTYVRRRLPPTGHNVAAVFGEDGLFRFRNARTRTGGSVFDACDAPPLFVCLIDVRRSDG